MTSPLVDDFWLLFKIKIMTLVHQIKNNDHLLGVGSCHNLGVVVVVVVSLLLGKVIVVVVAVDIVVFLLQLLEMLLLLLLLFAC